MNFTAKQARCHYENGNGIPLSIKSDISNKLIEMQGESE